MMEGGRDLDKSDEDEEGDDNENDGDTPGNREVVKRTRE